MFSRSLKHAAKCCQEKKELKVSYDGIAYKFKPDPEICAYLAIYTPYWLPARIYFDMVDSTRAYTKEMAKLAKNLTFFLSGEGQKLTDIDSVDRQLIKLYHDIYLCAEENGKRLERPILIFHRGAPICNKVARPLL